MATSATAKGPMAHEKTLPGVSSNSTKDNKQIEHHSSNIYESNKDIIATTSTGNASSPSSSSSSSSSSPSATHGDNNCEYMHPWLVGK